LGPEDVEDLSKKVEDPLLYNTHHTYIIGLRTGDLWGRRRCGRFGQEDYGALFYSTHHIYIMEVRASDLRGHRICGSPYCSISEI
jgi:hypothetical protein